MGEAAEEADEKESRGEAQDGSRMEQQDSPTRKGMTGLPSTNGLRPKGCVGTEDTGREHEAGKPGKGLKAAGSRESAASFASKAKVRK